MSIEYLGKNGLTKFLEKLRETFSETGHSHTKADISDYTEITVDSALSDSSTNPVQNKIIKAEFDAHQYQIDRLSAETVKFTAQTLTEEQKTQSRKNIGMNKLLMTVSKDASGNITADKSVSEVYEAYTSGVPVLAEFSQDDETYVCFVVNHTYEDGNYKEILFTGQNFWDSTQSWYLLCSFDNVEMDADFFEMGYETFATQKQIENSLSETVKFTEQTLTEAQKTQARTNIGATYTAGAGMSMSGNAFINAGVRSVATGNEEGCVSVNTNGNTSEVQIGGYDNLKAADMLAMPGSLKWDGVIGDKEYIVQAEQDGMLIALVHLTDEVPDMNLVGEIGGFAFCSTGGLGEIGAFGGAIAPIEDMEGCYDTGDGLFMIATQDTTIEGFGTFKKGIWTMAYNLLPSGYDISVLYGSGLIILGWTFGDTSGSGGGYFETVEKVTDLGDTLTWDGNTAGKTAIRMPLSDTQYIELVHISDSIPTRADLANGCTVTVENEATVVSGEDAQLSFGEDGFATIADAIVVVPYAGYVQVDKTLPKSGLYFMKNTSSEEVAFVSSITIPGYNFTGTGKATVIKTEHLPEALQFGEHKINTCLTVTGNTIFWDGKTGDADGVLYKVADGGSWLLEAFEDATAVTGLASDLQSPAAVSLTSLGDGIYTTLGDDPDGIRSDEYDFRLLIVTAGGSVNLGAGEQYMQKGVYAIAKSDALGVGYTFTFEGYNFDGKLSQITRLEEKYLPESIPNKTEVKAMITESVDTLEASMGDLNDLATTDQTSLVAAINEVVAAAGSADGAVMYTEQTLEESQQAQARANIDAIGKNELCTVEAFDTVEYSTSEGLESFILNGMTYFKVCDLTEEFIASITSVIATGNIPETKVVVDGVERPCSEPGIYTPDGYAFVSDDFMAIVAICGPASCVDMGLPSAGLWSVIGSNHVTSVTVTGLPLDTKMTVREEFLPDNIGGSDIPDPSTAADGAFLRVSNGAWALETIPNAEEASF